MTTKKELQAIVDLQKEQLEKISVKVDKLVGTNAKTVTGKIIAGTNFTYICKEGGISVSFMPKDTTGKFPIPAIWISKGKHGMPIQATKTGLDTLRAVCDLVEEKAELTA